MIGFQHRDIHSKILCYKDPWKNDFIYELMHLLLWIVILGIFIYVQTGFMDKLFSKKMNSILNLDPLSKTICVDPGICIPTSG